MRNSLSSSQSIIQLLIVAISVLLCVLAVLGAIVPTYAWADDSGGETLPEVTISLYDGSGTTWVKSYSADALARLAEESQDNESAVYYQAENMVYAAPAKQYVTIDAIIADSGLANWISLEISGPADETYVLTSELNSEGCFYPAQTNNAYSTRMAERVPAVIAYKWGSARITFNALLAGRNALDDKNLEDSIRFFVGAEEDDYVAGNLKSDRFINGELEVVANADKQIVDNGVTEISGDNRYETMSLVASQAFGVDSCDTVILTGGENYPDALAAAALAGAYNAPVLITPSDSLSDEVVAQIKRLGATKVGIVGGLNSVSKAVEDQLTEKVGIAANKISRISGTSRQKTALYAFRVLSSLNGEKSSNVNFDTVIVASGKSFADSLSISAYSYAKTTPIVLTNDDGSLDESVFEAIASDAAVKNIVIVGGENSVSIATEDAFKDDSRGYKVTRLGGENRYETSSLIASWTLEEGMSASIVTVADGRNFPDALTGSAFAGKAQGILLLAADSDEGLCAVNEVIKPHVEDIDALVFLGGESSIPVSVREAASDAAGYIYKPAEDDDPEDALLPDLE